MYENTGESIWFKVRRRAIETYEKEGRKGKFEGLCEAIAIFVSPYSPIPALVEKQLIAEIEGRAEAPAPNQREKIDAHIEPRVVPAPKPTAAATQPPAARKKLKRKVAK